MLRRRPVFSAFVGAVAGILILAGGCDRNPTGSSLGDTTLSARSLLGGQLQPAFYQGGQPGAYVGSIGPEGGKLDFGIGTVTFPAGAVDRRTNIVAKVDGKTAGVSFRPHLVFPASAQPTVTLSYGGTGIDPQSLRVIHFSDDDVLLDVLTPTVNTADQTASVQANSFSGFILGTYRSQDQ